MPVDWVIDYLPLMEAVAVGLSEEEKLKREIAKTNYVTVRDRKSKKERFR